MGQGHASESSCPPNVPLYSASRRAESLHSPWASGIRISMGRSSAHHRAAVSSRLLCCQTRFREPILAGKQEPFFLENATRWAEEALRDAGADVVMAERAGSHGDAFGEKIPLMVAWAFGR